MFILRKQLQFSVAGFMKKGILKGSFEYIRAGKGETLEKVINFDILRY